MILRKLQLAFCILPLCAAPLFAGESVRIEQVASQSIHTAEQSVTSPVVFEAFAFETDSVDRLLNEARRDPVRSVMQKPVAPHFWDRLDRLHEQSFDFFELEERIYRRSEVATGTHGEIQQRAPIPFGSMGQGSGPVFVSASAGSPFQLQASRSERSTGRLSQTAGQWTGSAFDQLASRDVRQDLHLHAIRQGAMSRHGAHRTILSDSRPVLIVFLFSFSSSSLSVFSNSAKLSPASQLIVKCCSPVAIAPFARAVWLGRVSGVQT